MNKLEPNRWELNSKISWPLLIQLVSSALAAFLLLSSAVVIATAELSKRVIHDTSTSDPTRSLMIASSLAFAGVLVIPSAWYAWKRIAYPGYSPAPRQEPKQFGLILTVVVIVVVIGSLWLGNIASKDSRLSWYLLPPLNILATGLPALWLIFIGTRGLISGSKSRLWGVFASGLILGPIIILVLEFVALIGVGILAILWILADPSLSSNLNTLLLIFQNAGPDPQTLLTNLIPFLLNPGILILLFGFASLLVPIIEETIKPIGVWLLVGQKLAPSQGFGFGVISGAGFGLFENLGNTSSGGDAWALLASARISTLLLHSLTAGLVGWALVSAWRQKQYLKLGVVYLLSVLIHGVWNGLAVLSIFSTLQDQTNLNIPQNLLQIGNYSATGIAALGAFNLVFFIGFSAALRRQSPHSTPPPSGEMDSRNGTPQNSTSTDQTSESSSVPDDHLIVPDPRTDNDENKPLNDMESK